MDRRDFLGLAGLGLVAGVTGCAPSAPLAYRPGRLPRLRISPDRVIKETVGLRPFRTGGPRVEAEPLADKTLVHHYGHGGSGWSLSWGTARQAADLATANGARTFAVLGCGVIGLTTARTLQDRGCQVTIYTRDLPPHVTSSMATGTWSPSYRLCAPEAITPTFRQNWQDAATYAFRAHQNHLGRGELANWIDHYVVHDPARPAAGHGDLHLPGAEAAATLLRGRQNPFRGAMVTREPALLFQIPAYLDRLTEDFLLRGGRLVVQTFHAPADVAALPEPVVMNCTGLGAQQLFGDAQLMPIAGQLSFLMPQPEVTYRLSTPNGYFIPRRDGVILGGNAIIGSWDQTPDPAQTQKVLAALTEAVGNMRS